MVGEVRLLKAQGPVTHLKGRKTHGRSPRARLEGQQGATRRDQDSPLRHPTGGTIPPAACMIKWL